MLQTFEAQRAILLDSPETPPMAIHDYLPLGEALAQKIIHPLFTNTTQWLLLISPNRRSMTVIRHLR